MSTDREDYARLSELLDRLVMSGPKAAHVSASETHEIHDDGMACIEEVAALRAQVEALTRERNILRAALSGEPYALEQENARLRRERYDAMCMVEALRENYAAMMKKLTDPIVREKMLHPGPPIIKAEAHTLIAERDAALARAERAESTVQELQAEVERLDADYQRLADGTEESKEWHEMRDDRDAAIARAEKVEKRLADYDTRLTDVMPDGMKCWHQNSRDEWPEVAAWVVTNLRELLAWEEERAEKAEAERDAYRKAKQENDELFMLERDAALAEAARLVEVLREAREHVPDHMKQYVIKDDGLIRVEDPQGQLADRIDAILASVGVKS